MGEADPGSHDVLQLEMQQALELARQVMGFAVQAAGFFIAADTLLLAYGLSQRRAGFLLLAGFAVVGVVVTLWRGLEGLAPIVYVAIYLERLLVVGHVTLVASYVRIREPIVYDRLNAALNIDDVQEREQSVRSAISLSSLSRSRTFQALAGMLVVHMALFVLALTVWDYTFP